LSAPGGGEGRGEVGIPERSPITHLTLSRLRRGPLPLPPEGRRGKRRRCRLGVVVAIATVLASAAIPRAAAIAAALMLLAIPRVAAADESSALYRVYWAGLPAGDIKLTLRDDAAGYRDEIAIR